MPAEIAIVVAIDEKRGIGKDGDIPWRGKIPEDMDRFKDKSMGHPVIMGRLTYDSIKPRYRPLVGRPNIVVTKDQFLEIPGCSVAHSVDEAISIALALKTGRVCVIGGTQIYKEAIPLTDILFLTRIEGDFNADRFFPEYGEQFPHLRWTQSSSHNGINYTFEDLTRIP